MPVTLRRPGKPVQTYFTSLAMDIVSHAEAAIALKENDTLNLYVHGWTQGTTSFSVAYVTGLDGHYTMVVTTSASNSALLNFNMQMADNSWSKLSGNQSSSFSVPTTGMYWVTARVVPVSIDVVIRVTTENSMSTRILFNVYGEKYRAVSCSGAFHLSAGSVVKAKNPVTGTYGEDTLLSFVYLEGNGKPHTGPDEHIAFTGTLTSKLQRGHHQVVPFPGHLTNYGRLYTNNGSITIHRSGSYMISLRADPPADVPAELLLVINHKIRWISYSEEGVPSGQTIPMMLEANDTLVVITYNTPVLETGSLFSIAFLRS